MFYQFESAINKVIEDYRISDFRKIRDTVITDRGTRKNGRLIFSYGTAVKVLSPIKLITRINEQIISMSNLYINNKVVCK